MIISKIKSGSKKGGLVFPQVPMEGKRLEDFLEEEPINEISAESTENTDDESKESMR